MSHGTPSAGRALFSVDTILTSKETNHRGYRRCVLVGLMPVSGSPTSRPLSVKLEIDRMSGWTAGQILRRLELLLSVTLVTGSAFCQADEHPDSGQCANAAERLHASSIQ